MMIDDDVLRRWGAIHRKVEKGQTIFYEGDNAHFYYQVVSGKVKMVNGNEKEREFIQGLFGMGQSFGEPPLFCDEPYPASAIAERDTVLLRLTKERFLQLLKNNGDIHFAFTRLLAHRLRFKTALSKEICCHAPEQVIEMLIRQFRVGGETPGRTRVDLTRQQIADMTGLRVETVIRTIRSMYRKGSLLLEKGKVYI